MKNNNDNCKKFKIKFYFKLPHLTVIYSDISTLRELKRT